MSDGHGLDALVELDRLSRVFVDTCCDSKKKSVISYNQLNVLLSLYPDRPRECAEGAKRFVEFAEHATGMDVTAFVKRCGLLHRIHEIDAYAGGSMQGFVEVLEKGNNLQTGPMLCA